MTWLLGPKRRPIDVKEDVKIGAVHSISYSLVNVPGFSGWESPGGRIFPEARPEIGVGVTLLLYDSQVGAVTWENLGGAG